MSDGWETKRRRGPGHDWVIIKLGKTGRIQRVEVDTSHFKGNCPESCSLRASNAGEVEVDTLTDPAMVWRDVLPRTKLQPHTGHTFVEELIDAGPITHLIFNIFPDGGVSRLRVWGEKIN